MKIRALIFISLGIGASLVSCRSYSGSDEKDNASRDSSVETRSIQKTSSTDDSLSSFKAVDSEELQKAQPTGRQAKERISSSQASNETQKVSPEPVTISRLNRSYPANIDSYNDLQKQVYPIIVRNPVIESVIWPYRKLSVSLDNDLFSNTDRYYTNGIHIVWQSPAIAFWKLNAILPVNLHRSIEYNSIELHHAMYTPYSTKIPPVLKDDRPYASTLFIRLKRRTDTPLKRYSQSASLDIGVIGSAALGSYLQKGVHASLPTNDEPLGWETQISNDIILNYNYEVTGQLNRSGAMGTYVFGSASLGTLRTCAEGGFRIKLSNDQRVAGLLSESTNNISKVIGKKWQFSFDSEVSARLVGYNATLSGGFLNKDNYFVLLPGEIKRMVVLANAGFTASYGKYGVRVAQYYTSKEFIKGKNHFWGQIGINIGF